MLSHTVIVYGSYDCLEFELPHIVSSCIEAELLVHDTKRLMPTQVLQFDGRQVTPTDAHIAEMLREGAGNVQGLG